MQPSGINPRVESHLGLPEAFLHRRADLMFIKKQFRSLLAYHAHINRLLHDCAAKITDAEFNAPGMNDRSIRLLLFHILNTDHYWRVGLETGQYPPPLQPDDYLTLSSLADGLTKEQTAFNAYLDRVTEDEIRAEQHLIAYGGYEEDISRWRILQHVVLHGEQHQGEPAYLLTNYGQSPGDLDYIDFRGPPETQ